jgi:hypothetical protein
MHASSPDARRRQLSANGRRRLFHQLFTQPERVRDVLHFLEETGACARPRADERTPYCKTIRAVIRPLPTTHQTIPHFILLTLPHIFPTAIPNSTRSSIFPHSYPAHSVHWPSDFDAPPTSCSTSWPDPYSSVPYGAGNAPSAFSRISLGGVRGISGTSPLSDQSSPPTPMTERFGPPTRTNTTNTGWPPLSLTFHPGHGTSGALRTSNARHHRLAPLEHRNAPRYSQLYLDNMNGMQEKPDIDSLKECMKDMLNLPGQGPIYIIIDALDECPNSSGMSSAREEVLELIRELVNLELCVASQPEVDIRVILDPLMSTLKISLHDETGKKEDIIKYIESVVRSDRSMRRWKEDRQLVVDTLSSKADGM